MKAYKGFNQDMACRGFQYKEGETYETERASVCECGFHACENPMDCLGYYEPGESVYHEVELDGNTSRRKNGDTKVAATKIKIGARLTIAGLVKAAIEYTMSKVIPGAKSDEDHGSASATGYNSAASATGYKSAASATGDNSAASATGDKSAASATGYNSAASATGDKSAAVAGKDTAIAVAWGLDSKAKGVKGSHIVLSDWRWDSGKERWVLCGAKMIQIDGKQYKEDTWYVLQNGEVVEAEDVA